RRLNKKGRSLNLHLNTQVDNSTSTNQVDERTNLYDALGVIQDTVIVDQTRLSENKSNNLGASINISEPITKQINLTLGYNFNTSARNALVNAYDNDTDAISSLDSLYSKNETNNAHTNGMNVNLNYHSNKLNINLSNRTMHRHQELTDRYRIIGHSRKFWQNNWNANVSYSMTNNKNQTIDYQNNSKVPSFSQLQPIHPSSNKLYRQLGNPDLKRETNNNIIFIF